MRLSMRKTRDREAWRTWYAWRPIKVLTSENKTIWAWHQKVEKREEYVLEEMGDGGDWWRTYYRLPGSGRELEDNGYLQGVLVPTLFGACIIAIFSTLLAYNLPR